MAGWIINWAMWTQHDPRVPLGVIAFISKGCFCQTSNYRAFLYLNSSSLHVVLNRYWAHTLIKGIRKIKFVHEIDLVCDHFKNTKIKLVTNLESPELSVYAFKPVCRTLLETLSGKLQNLLGMKLTTGATLLLLSAVDNDIYFVHVTGVNYEINWIKEHLLY